MEVALSPSPRRASRAPHSSRGVESEVNTCTTYANARAQKSGGAFLAKYTFAPSAIPTSRVHNAFFGLINGAPDICRLFGVITWKRGNVGSCLFREKSYFEVKNQNKFRTSK